MVKLIKKKIRKNLSGTKFDKIKLIKYIGSTDRKRQYYECECECGYKYITALCCLKNKTKFKKECKICRNKRGKNHYAWKGFGDIPKSFITYIKHGAKDRNLDFNLNIKYLDFLLKKQKYICPLTGIKLKFESKYGQKDGNISLDRIDSSKGYIKGNVRWVHTTINWFKRDLTDDELFTLSKFISNNIKADIIPIENIKLKIYNRK